jgi:hypothetical protein
LYEQAPSCAKLSRACFRLGPLHRLRRQGPFADFARHLKAQGQVLNLKFKLKT